MNFKIFLFICFHLIFEINSSNGENVTKNYIKRSIDFPQQKGNGPIFLPLPVIRPTTSPVNVPKYYDCPTYTTSTDKWVTFDSKVCYYFSTYYTRGSWHDANEHCLSKGANLASIHSGTDNGWLSVRPNVGWTYGDVYWIGLHSLGGKRGQFKWTDNTPINYDIYSGKTSNGDQMPSDVRFQGRCVGIRSSPYNNLARDKGYWYREDCNTVYNYICEKSLSDPVVVPPTSAPPGNCPPDWYQFENEKCIKYINIAKNFNDAIKTCDALGAELLTIHSQNEQDFITSLIADKPTAYIGMKRNGRSYSWTWDSQKRVDFMNWNTLADMNFKLNCVTLNTNLTLTGKWVRTNCNETHPVICEKDKSTTYPNPSTLDVQSCKISGFDNFFQYRNSCYFVVDSNGLDSNQLKDFSDAEKNCQGMKGSHLVSIVDPFEQSFLRYYLTEYGSEFSDEYWIGLKSDVQSNTTAIQAFKWTDDWPNYFTNWDRDEPMFADQPQEECVSFFRSNGTWRTTFCDSNLPFICKISTNSVPKINSNKNGICPPLNGKYDKKFRWVDVDKTADHCYWFSVDLKGSLMASVMTYNDAAYQCRRRNGTLASIHSKHELMLLSNKLTKTSYYSTWIGLSKDTSGLYGWEDGSPLDFTYWDPTAIPATNTTTQLDDHSSDCVEIRSSDLMWKQAPCLQSGGYVRYNYYMCSAKKIYTSSSNEDSGHAGRTAGIVIGVLLGVAVLIALGLYAFRRMNLKVPQMPSFENPLRASRRTGGIKPQTLQNNISSQNDLTNSKSNENPFIE